MTKGRSPEKTRAERRYVIRLFFCRCVILLWILFRLFFWITVFRAGIMLREELALLFSVLAVYIALRIAVAPRPSGYKLLWAFALLLFPIPALVFYLLFRMREVSFATPERAADCVSDADGLCPDDRRIVNFLASSGAVSDTRSRAVYYSDGESMFASLLSAISHAEYSVFLEYFIIDDGEMFERILECLYEKSSQGVDVRILMDDVGCLFLPPRRLKKTLAKHGIRMAVFNVLSPYVGTLPNYRDHRKTAVIDGKIAFTGGQNLGDEYIHRRERFGHWKDAAVSVEGPAARRFHEMFLDMWETSRKNDGEPALPPIENAAGADGVLAPYGTNPFGKPTVHGLYLSMIYAARRYLYITTPYLIPDDSITEALKIAASGGVDVRILLPHHPDKVLVNRVTKSYYQELLAAGVRLYEYTPGFIHAKMLLSDDRIASVGSANLDYRSLYLSYESGVFFSGGQVIADIRRDFQNLFAVSEEITEGKLPRTRGIRRVPLLLYRFFAPLL